MAVKIDEIPRRKLRYYCFRLQNKDVNGVPLDGDVPAGVRKAVQDLDGFAGWEHFAGGAPKGWDLSREAPWKIVARNVSIDAEWNAELSRTVQELPLSKADQAKADLRAEAKAADDERGDV